MISQLCEGCEQRRPTHTCAGLEVPMLGFCDECAEIHRRTCPEIKAGRATIVKHERYEKPSKDQTG
jgi:hypothetical protein